MLDSGGSFYEFLEDISDDVARGEIALSPTELQHHVQSSISVLLPGGFDDSFRLSSNSLSDFFIHDPLEHGVSKLENIENSKTPMSFDFPHNLSKTESHQLVHAVTHESNVNYLLPMLQHLLADSDLCGFLVDRESFLEISPEKILESTEYRISVQEYAPKLVGSTVSDTLIPDTNAGIAAKSNQEEPLMNNSAGCLLIPHGMRKHAMLLDLFSLQDTEFSAHILARYLFGREIIQQEFFRGICVPLKNGQISESDSLSADAVLLIAFQWTLQEKLMVTISELGFESQRTLSMLFEYLPEDGTLPSKLLRWGTLLCGNALDESFNTDQVHSLKCILGVPVLSNVQVQIRLVNPSRGLSGVQVVNHIRKASQLEQSDGITQLKLSALDKLAQMVHERSQTQEDLEYLNIGALDDETRMSFSEMDGALMRKTESNQLRIHAVESLAASVTTDVWKRAMSEFDSELAERAFGCELCSFRFKKKHDLKRHFELVHLQRKDLRCSLCSARFGRGSNLRRHMRNVHNETRAYVCKYCRTGFHSETLYNSHIITCTPK